MSADRSATFCANCGQRQPRTEQRPTDLLDGISDRTASVLCYVPVLGVIPAIVFLAAQRFRGNFKVRFNAFQSVYLFVTWLVVSSALPVLLIGLPGWHTEHGLVEAARALLFFCWVYLLIKALHLEEVRLPILGDLAARSTMEQL